ncbi:hypothetical protein [Nocardioides daejeonensis]|uniref:hypothetical protein n=1 Tax=Nocardioides daejeonensis TaxID=1046556 RepID=UPI000D743716|nr:hypothetical protein [Nocardioides daejeonensis]
MIEIDARHQPHEVADLDGGTLLGLISEDRVRRWKGARRDLRLAYQWAVLNPPTADQPRAVLAEQCLYPDDADLKVSGEGTPDVAVLAVEDLSAAACISRAAALALIADTLDLHHRLPLLWSKVEDLAMPGWTARRVAELTRRLSFRAARWFDTELHKTGRTGWPTIERTLAQATVTFHPELVRDPRAPKSRDDWGVWVQHPQARDGSVCAAVGGTSELTAFGDSLDLARFLDLLTTEAAALAVLGDTGTLQQRRATALGRLAEDGQPTLGFDQAGTTGRGHDSPGHGRAEGDSTANAAAGGGTGGAPRPAPSRGCGCSRTSH